MLSGEGNPGKRWKQTIGQISRKATLHVQQTFFLYISLPLFCTTTMWNFQKLLRACLQVASHPGVFRGARFSSLPLAWEASLQGKRVTLLLGFTLASRSKLALVCKQISQVGLPITHHPGQLYKLCWRVSSCAIFFVTVFVNTSCEKRRNMRVLG